MEALDAGAEDFVVEEGSYEVYTDPTSFSTARENLEKVGYNLASAEVSMIPSNYITLDEEGTKKVLRMLDWFDENDDVQNVYHNADLPEEEVDE